MAEFSKSIHGINSEDVSACYYEAICFLMEVSYDFRVPVFSEIFIDIIIIQSNDEIYYKPDCQLYCKEKVQLSWAKLSWIELNWAELSWVELRWIGLNWAELSWIGLNWAGLSWFEQNSAKLSWTELSWILLSWAGLSRTELSWSEFSLNWADLSQNGTKPDYQLLLLVIL